MTPPLGRVVITKVGMDTHDLGARLVSARLRDAGFEVVYLGKFQTPESIVDAAISEDADVIGISSLSANTLEFSARILDVLRRREAPDIAVIAGGVIHANEAEQLVRIGVAAVFGPHSQLDDIVAATRRAVESRHSAARPLAKGVD